MENSPKDLKKLCRACLSDSNDMIALDSTNEEHEKILDMFKEITQIEDVEIWKSLYPSHICIVCRKNVIDTYNFKNTCLKSNQLIEDTLREMTVNEFETKPVFVEVKRSDNENDETETSDVENNPELPTIDTDVVTDNISSSDSDSDSKPKKKKVKRSYNTKRDSEEKKKVKSKKFDTKLVLEAIAEFRENHRHKYQKTCMFCQLETVSYIALATHIANFHKEYKGKWCFMCSQVVEDLEEHRKVHADMENVVCKFCSRTSKPAGYVSHLKTHLASKPFQCTYCQRGFMRMDSLTTHLKAHAHEKPHLDERPHKCPNCRAAFADSKTLSWHVAKHGPFKCDKCSKRFKYKKRLKEHECTTEIDSLNETQANLETMSNNMDIMPDFDDYIPEDEKVSLPNFCHPCNRMVKDLLVHSQLYHSNTSDNPNEYQCFVCKKTYDTKSKLRNHFRTHEEKLYSCKQCDKKFKSPSQLRLHEQIHTTDRPFVCNVCGKAFGRGSTLKTHMIGHSEKPEVCELCGKRFCRPAELKLHMTKHAGIKPYLCPECGKSFSQKSHLTEHSKSHSEERPHQCPFCEKAFKSKSILTGHIKIHKGEKAFKCMECGYGAYTQFRLSQHILRQHEKTDGGSDVHGNTHICVICKLSFAKIYKLNVHMQSAHKVVFKTEMK